MSNPYLAFVDTAGVIQVRLDAPRPPMAVLEAAKSGLKALADVVGDSSGRLTAALHDAGFSTSDPEGNGPDHLPGLPLAGALRAIRAGRPCPSVLIYTADEAFWPGRCDPALTRRAFRIFVSRLRGAPRSALYGAFLGDPALHLSGDQPSPAALVAAEETVHRDPGLPQVVDLRSGEVTGRLTDPHAGWRADAGRLCVVATVRTHVLATGGAGEPLYWTVGHTAFPNLSTLPKLGDPALATIAFPPAGGADTSRRLASVKCHAEGVERFASGDVDVDKLRRSAAEDLDGHWLDPTTVIAYSEAQRKRLGLRRFDPSTPNWWVSARTEDGPVWIPASLVYYPFADLPEWLHPSAVSSNGVAAFSDPEGARRRAWCELVERDAFQRARLIGVAGGVTRMPVHALPAAAVKIVSALVGRGEVTVLRLPSPTGMPVTMVRLDTDDGVNLGLSAGTSEDDTVVKAATEAYLQATHSPSRDVEVVDVASPEDHAALYRQPHWRERLRWMLEAPLCERKPSRAAGPTTIARTAHWIDLHHSSELTVVRVIDPALIPITFGYDSDPTARPDFAELMRASGLSADEPLAPHPFA